jgi:2-iminobutanoate/2-iminopropanoate deaminase
MKIICLIAIVSILLVACVLCRKEFCSFISVINTDNAPKAIGPYSQAVAANGFIYVSGQVPIDPHTNVIVSGNISAQTARCMENIKAILERAGSSMDKIVKTTIYLKHMSDFESVNKIYAPYFKDKFPARVCVEVSTLPKNVDIEIDAIAVKK